MWASPFKRLLFRGLARTNAATLWVQRHLSKTHHALFADAKLGFGLRASDVVVVLVPHPDDETLGLGGTLACLADAGIHVHLLLLTDGSLSGAGALGALSPNERASIRLKEFQAAIHCLSPKISYSGPVFIERPMISADDKAVALQKALSLVKDLNPKAIFSPPPFDFHPHHVFAADLAAEMVAAGRTNTGVTLFNYEVQSPLSMASPWFGIVINPLLEARCKKARRAYVTQAISAQNAARLKWYRRVQTQGVQDVEIFLAADDLACDQPRHIRGLSGNPMFDLRLLR